MKAVRASVRKRGSKFMLEERRTLYHTLMARSRQAFVADIARIVGQRTSGKSCDFDSLVQDEPRLAERTEWAWESWTLFRELESVIEQQSLAHTHM